MTSRIRHAMVFAAGLGTRMRPLTRTTPKPLIEVGGRALLDHTLERLAEAELERIVVNTHHLAEQIAAHLLVRWSHLAIQISHEDPILETGGAIVRALPLLGDEPFFSANADSIWVDAEQAALSRLASAFDATRMDALLLLHPVERALGYHGPGDFDLVRGGEEARTLRRHEHAPYVFTGLQILHPRLFRGRREEPFSLREIYRAAEQPDGTLHRVFGLLHDGDFLHVGSPDEHAEAEAYFSDRRSR